MPFQPVVLQSPTTSTLSSPSSISPFRQNTDTSFLFIHLSSSRFRVLNFDLVYFVPQFCLFHHFFIILICPIPLLICKSQQNKLPRKSGSWLPQNTATTGHFISFCHITSPLPPVSKCGISSQSLNYPSILSLTL